MNHLLKLETREEAINAERLEKQRRAPKPSKRRTRSGELRLRQPRIS